VVGDLSAASGMVEAFRFDTPSTVIGFDDLAVIAPACR
jgi:hypothetical protein